jgi:hypothetical protein
MSGDKAAVAAARKYVRDHMLSGDMYELIFHRHRESREKMASEEIFRDWCLLRLRSDPNFSFRQTGPGAYEVRRGMSEAEIEQTYLAATRKNDPKAHRALINEAITYLRGPDLINRYAVEALGKHMMMISKKRGPKAEKNFIRDAMIVCVIEDLQYEFGLNPTRNREEKTRESGCSIVASVLTENGLDHLTEQAVAKIWQHRPSWP